LSFGEDFPGRDDPLDGTVKVLEHDSGVYQYFMKVVPTEYVLSQRSVLFGEVYFSINE
jgi:hypothetical protein